MGGRRKWGHQNCMQRGAHTQKQAVYPVFSEVAARCLHWLSRQGLGRTGMAKTEPFKGFKELTHS